MKDTCFSLKGPECARTQSQLPSKWDRKDIISRDLEKRDCGMMPIWVWDFLWKCDNIVAVSKKHFEHIKWH